MKSRIFFGCRGMSYLFTYVLTPWSRVLLEKLTGSAASQEIPRIFGTRRFVIVLTSARHLSLSRANSIQSPQPPPTSWRSILILSSHLRLGLPNGVVGCLTPQFIVAVRQLLGDCQSAASGQPHPICQPLIEHAF